MKLIKIFIFIVISIIILADRVFSKPHKPVMKKARYKDYYIDEDGIVTYGKHIDIYS